MFGCLLGRKVLKSSTFGAEEFTENWERKTIYWKASIALSTLACWVRAPVDEENRDPDHLRNGKEGPAQK